MDDSANRLNSPDDDVSETKRLIWHLRWPEADAVIADHKLDPVLGAPQVNLAFGSNACVLKRIVERLNCCIRQCRCNFFRNKGQALTFDAQSALWVNLGDNALESLEE